MHNKWILIIEIFNYRLKNDTTYKETEHELYKNFIDVKSLISKKIYTFILVAVDGNTTKGSNAVDIEAPITGTF